MGKNLTHSTLEGVTRHPNFTLSWQTPVLEGKFSIRTVLILYTAYSACTPGQRDIRPMYTLRTAEESGWDAFNTQRKYIEHKLASTKLSEVGRLLLNQEGPTKGRKILEEKKKCSKLLLEKGWGFCCCFVLRQGFTIYSLVGLENSIEQASLKLTESNFYFCLPSAELVRGSDCSGCIIIKSELTPVITFLDAHYADWLFGELSTC